MKNNSPSFLRSMEGNIFLIGCGLIIFEVLFFILFGNYIPELKEYLLPVIFTDLVAGIGACISLGLSLGLSKFMVIIISVVFNLTWLFVLFPLIIYSYVHLIEIKLVGKVFNSAKKKAERQQVKIEKWGALGIVFFVWVPFFSTGPLIGAIVGRLIGMRIIPVLSVVTSAMIISAISWTFAFDYLIELTEGAGKIIPAILAVLILCISIFRRLWHRYYLAKQKMKAK